MLLGWPMITEFFDHTPCTKQTIKSFLSIELSHMEKKTICALCLNYICDIESILSSTFNHVLVRIFSHCF